MHLEADLANNVPERSTLPPRNLELELRRLPSTGSSRKSSSSPRRSYETDQLVSITLDRRKQQLTSMNLLDVALKLKRMRITKRDVDDPVVSQSAQRAEEGGLLSSTKAGGGDEEPSVLARELASRPESTGGVPERLYVSYPPRRWR